MTSGRLCCLLWHVAARRVLQACRPEEFFRPAGQQTARWVKLIAVTTRCVFTLLIKIFIQSHLISNILTIVQQIDCTDLRIIFSLHILLLSTSFLLLILLLRGERSGHKREWHKCTWRRYRRTTKERRLFTGWKDFKVRSTVGRCLQAALSGTCQLRCKTTKFQVRFKKSVYGKAHCTRVVTSWWCMAQW